VAQSVPTPQFLAAPYSYGEARAIAQELGLSEPVAITLVRRGYRTPAQAREFLEAGESHDPLAFDSMGEVCERLLAAIGDGRRITVHGDYDADGVCSTAILVRALRELGADCDWYLPDRLADGYGLSVATVERLGGAGTRLLLTADCGIGCAAEIARAQELGMEAIVTDHHSPPAELPDCPILHPVISGYPFPELCATGVAYKLSAALRGAAGRDAEDADADLDVVALATVADLVPLRGENRSLVRRGLAEIRRARRPGLRALIAAAGVDPAQLDEGDLAFRLGPRINAAGRLYRADAGVELLLTSDEARAVRIAEELSRANLERRAAERELEQAAELARAQLPDALREAPALVLAGEGWHPGVVGIVASRLVERHGVPTVLIALDGEHGRGSGRSIPAFDLLGGLEACAEHLSTFGGHRAAAGLGIEADRVEPFREAFAAHAAGALSPQDLIRGETVDAVVSGSALGLGLAEEIGRLAPFGMGNPGVRLLVPSARVDDVRPMGKEGKHARFSLRSGSGGALGVAFGRGSLPVGADDAVDLAVRLELNHWNGTVEPRVVLRELYPLGEENGAGDGCPCRAHIGEPEWWARLEAELERDLTGAAGAMVEGPAAPGEQRELVAHPPGGAIAVIGELVSAGTGVLALCADASRRRALVEHAASPLRFGAVRAAIACGRCPDAGLAERFARQAAAGGLAMADYAVLERHPGLCDAFEHVVLVDPPPDGRLALHATKAGAEGTPGFTHVSWGEGERKLALQVHEHEWGLREPLAALYRALRDERADADQGALGAALAGPGKHPRSPELTGRCLRVLGELGLVHFTPDPGGRGVGVVSSEETDLERSEAFRAYRARHEEGKRYLSRPRNPD
jgi:single-stranded-DNA-specific exonuclease